VATGWSSVVEDCIRIGADRSRIEADGRRYEKPTKRIGRLQDLIHNRSWELDDGGLQVHVVQESFASPHSYITLPHSSVEPSLVSAQLLRGRHLDIVVMRRQVAGVLRTVA
jgi:hypothetical protein